MSQLLPIFPLDTVLMPGAPLPLHIFEPRYRTLVSDVWGENRITTGDPGFGIVSVTHPDGLLAERPPARHQRAGAALDGVLDDLAAVGTFAEIVEAEIYDDGRSDLLTIGRRRFRLLGIEATDRPYWQARIEWLPEEDGRLSGTLAEAARARCARYVRDLAELAGRDTPEIRFAVDPLALSYQVSRRLRLSTGERQELLEADDAGDRLRLANRLLRREIVLLTRTRTVAVSPGLLQLDTTPN